MFFDYVCSQLLVNRIIITPQKSAETKFTHKLNYFPFQVDLSIHPFEDSITMLAHCLSWHMQHNQRRDNIFPHRRGADVQLLNLNFSASSLKFLFELFSFFLSRTFLNSFRSALNKILGFL